MLHVPCRYPPQYSRSENRKIKQQTVGGEIVLNAITCALTTYLLPSLDDGGDSPKRTPNGENVYYDDIFRVSEEKTTGT